MKKNKKTSAKIENKHQEIHSHVDEIDAGDELFAWDTWEYPPYERSTAWYIIASIIGVGLIVYAVLTQNFLFAIIILMMGVMILVNSMRHPDRIRIYLTTLGIVIGDDFHSYKEIKDFSIIYEPPEVKILYIDFLSKLHPMVALPLEDSNPNAVRDTLLTFVYENLEREEETLSDMIGRLYKI